MLTFPTDKIGIVWEILILFPITVEQFPTKQESNSEIHYQYFYDDMKWTIHQGVVTYIPVVLTPATGIKVRSSGQAIKLETIKQSRCSFALLKSRSRWVLSLTPPTPGCQSTVKALLVVRSSDQGPKMAPIKF